MEPEQRLRKDSIADYIIVGAGSAGCVLANRLSADRSTRVMLVEAGSDDRLSGGLAQLATNMMMIHVPAGYARTLKDPRVNWLYSTDPDPGTEGRRHIWPRGRVLGGSSSINGLLYIRGQRRDYDQWRELGCEGWGWSDVAPYFARSISAEGDTSPPSDPLTSDGSIRISRPSTDHPVSNAVVKACVALGLPERDANGADQEGVSWFSVTAANGRRQSTAVGYLHRAMRRPNLRVETNALTTRILFDGRRASGVQIFQRGAFRSLRAARGVILCAGAVNSPQLLQLSGIGPRGLLEEMGIPLVADLQGVGANLQDHFVIPVTFRLKQGVQSLNEQTRGWRLAGEALRYAVSRTGLFAMSAAHVAAFCKSSPELEEPDIQFHIMPATTDMEKMARQKMELERSPGLTIAPCQLRPLSRGHVRIRSPEPTQHPSIAPNYLADPADQRIAELGIRWARRIAAQSPLNELVAHELMPGAEKDRDEELLAHARGLGTTIYHPVGTCAMGRSPSAVVDSRLCVHGIDGLRVVDASIMPRLVSGNTNAATIMIAEKAADMIVEDWAAGSRRS